jgi:hypothetical protein
MPSARQHPTGYPHGCFHRKRHRLSSRPATELRRTSFTQGVSPIPPTPASQPRTDKKLCTFILLEVIFCRDLGCDKKHNEKTEKYYPLFAALKKYWGRMEFVAIPIGHAGTTLSRTLDRLTAAFSTARPLADQTRASTGTIQPTIDSNARNHDYRMFKSLLDSLIDLAQSRLLGIIRNKKRLVDGLQGAVSRHRAHSAATPPHSQVATQQEAVTHTHRTRTTRVPESTAIT